MPDGVVDETTLGDGHVVTDELIKVDDVHVVGDETIGVGGLVKVRWLMQQVKGVESEIVGVASGIDALVFFKLVSSAAAGKARSVQKHRRIYTAHLPITPCISVDHLKLTKILGSSRSSSDSIPTPLACSLSIVALYFVFRAFSFSQHCLKVCI